MTEEMKELGRRAVACKGWRWMPGMLSRCSTDTRRAVYRWLVGLHTRHYGLVCIVQDKHGRPCLNVATLQPGPDDLPDFSDPATLGCLLSLVRDVWGWRHACCVHDEIGWCVSSGASCPLDLQDEAGGGQRFESEAEALVAALEAADERG